MNRKAQMVTIFFSLFLILAVITIIGVESANLQTNKNINSLIQEYNIPKLQYYAFLNALSKVNSITISNTTLIVLNETLQNIYKNNFQGINVSETLLNTSDVVMQLPKMPSNIVSYVPVTFYNQQPSATPSPFQQIVNASYTVYGNYSNANLSNIEFFYFNGTVIPSWLETRSSDYAVWWIKINGISAGSSLTVYMGFARKPANLFNTVTTGEAPTLSKTYGEYDDGNAVFNYYTNFTGPSLPNGWQADYYNSGASVTVNDGVTLTASYSGTILEQALVYLTTSDSTNEIFDAYRAPSSSGGACTLLGWDSGSPAGYTTISNTAAISLSNGYSGFACIGQTGGIFENSVSIASPMGAMQPTIASFYWINGKQSFWQNYSNEISASNTGYSPSPTNSIFLGGDWADSAYPAAGKNIVYYWVRLRAYPPNGVMPSAYFGGDLP
jgi:hypothetical protein